MKPHRLMTMLGVVALAFVMPFTAGASVKKEGAWPNREPKIDLEFDGKPSEGLKLLAKEAEWSLVVSNAVAVDGSGSNVHVNVEDQPADAVLEALFVGRDVVAYRRGKLITLTPATPALSPAPSAPGAPAGSPPPQAPELAADEAPPLPPSFTAPPVPTVRGEDRSVFGQNLVIRKDEIVHTVTVAGGTLQVEGTITGDLVIAGGSAKIASGGRVIGNATVFGGSLKLEDHARIDGDVGVAGGSLKREEGSIIGGHVGDATAESDLGPGKLRLHAGPNSDLTASPKENPSSRSRIAEAAHSFGQSMTKMALLFVLGCVLLALLAPRMEKVRVEIASRPMRSFAIGLVGTLLGSLGVAILLIVLCVTVIGIPVAFIGVLLAILAVYGAIASVLTTFGAAVLGHRTQNAYLHLLLGCGAFLVLSSIPWVGGIVTFSVTMIAIGALMATKLGGLLERKPRGSSGLLV